MPNAKKKPTKNKGNKKTTINVSEKESPKNKKSSSSSVSVFLILSIIILISSIGISVYFYLDNQEVKEEEFPWSKELRKRENVHKEKALDYLDELIETDENNPFLRYEKGRIYSKLQDFDRSIENLISSWEFVDNESKLTLAKKIESTSRFIYQRNPHKLTGISLCNVLNDVAQQSNNLYTYFLSSYCFREEMKYEECEIISNKGIKLLEKQKVSLPMQQVLYYESLKCKMEQDKYKEAKEDIKTLTAKNKEFWDKDIQLLDYYSTLLIKTSITSNQLQNSAHNLNKKVKEFDRNLISVNQNPLFINVLYNLANLYKLQDEYQEYEKIMNELWEEYWDNEVKDNESWECYSDSKFIPNYRHELNINEIILPETRIEGKKQTQYHVNANIMKSDLTFKKSNKFDKPIHEQELFAYKLHDAKVQFSNQDRETILVASKCNLHGFGNIIESKPPSGYVMSLKEKRFTPLSKGIILHSKLNELENVNIHCLPKLQFLVDNDWLGDYDSSVLLPKTKELIEFVELLTIEDTRITWISRNQLYQVDELTIFDYRPVNPKVPLGKPVVPLPLLQNLRENLLGDPIDEEFLDIVAIIRNTPNDIQSSIDIKNEISNIIDGIKESYAYVPEGTQVFEIDISGPVYHQIYAFKRARILISVDDTLLSNCMWMSPRANVIQLTQVPVSLSTSSILTSQLQLDYHIIPTLNSNRDDLILLELEQVDKKIRNILTR